MPALRCAIYARYSTDLQRDASIEDQVRLCTARAEREGWQVVETFHDAAISGASGKRPGLGELCEAMRAGRVDIVLAESLDRFWRDQEHIAGFYKRVIFDGARIVTVSEGEVNELHVGLKGTMGALHLKDLADKTRRGLEGRVRKGRCTGKVSSGYRIVRPPAGPNSEVERGLREPDPVEAALVLRIFQAYAAGESPTAIAAALNAEGIVGPGGGVWHAATIRGRSGRGDGMLRNPLYGGQIVWNRRRYVKDPASGTLAERRNPAEAVVTHPVPALRIVPDDLWQRVQARLVRDAAPRGPRGDARFWDTRRPPNLLTAKVFCGVCGKTYKAIAKDYLMCRAAHAHGCRNRRAMKRSVLTARVCEAIGSKLMDPALAARFAQAFQAEWDRLSAEARQDQGGTERELKAVETRIRNIVRAIEDGAPSRDLRERLEVLEAERARLEEALAATTLPPARIPPDMGTVYRGRVARLMEALSEEASVETLEAARALIERITVTPLDDGGPSGIELEGNLPAMLEAGGASLPTERSSAGRHTCCPKAEIHSRKVATGPHWPLAGGSLREDGVLPQGRITSLIIAPAPRIAIGPWWQPLRLAAEGSGRLTSRRSCRCARRRRRSRAR